MSEQPPEHGFADESGRYRLDARIATGGMGEVWRGTDTTLGREVAIKLLKNEYADDESFRTRFQTEAHHAASLHHPNIAAVYDFGEATAGDGSEVQRPFLVMELVDGQPLSALLRPDEPMDPDAVRDLLSQAADGLAAAHAAGIVHRDVKPANLLVTPDRQVKITDFGIARAAEGLGLTQTGEVMGTPQYLSPEQAQGQTATPASDVYSLGVVAFECLAGRRPYVADTAVATALAHLREPVPALPDFVPDDLATVVRRAMAKLPQDRFDDGAAFAAALRDPATAATQVVDAPPRSDETQLLTSGVPAAPVPVPGPTPGHSPENADRTRRRNSMWPILVVLAVVVVAVLAIFLVAHGLGGDDEPAQGPTRSPQRSPSTSDTGSQEPTEEPSSTAATSEAPPSSSAPPTDSASQSPTGSASSSAGSPSATVSEVTTPATPSDTATSSSGSSASSASSTSSRTPTTATTATTSPRPAAASSTTATSSSASPSTRGGVDSR